MHRQNEMEIDDEDVNPSVLREQPLLPLPRFFSATFSQNGTLLIINNLVGGIAGNGRLGWRRDMLDGTAAASPRSTLSSTATAHLKQLPDTYDRALVRLQLVAAAHMRVLEAAAKAARDQQQVPVSRAAHQNTRPATRVLSYLRELNSYNPLGLPADDPAVEESSQSFPSSSSSPSDAESGQSEQEQGTRADADLGGDGSGLNRARLLFQRSASARKSAAAAASAAASASSATEAAAADDLNDADAEGSSSLSEGEYSSEHVDDGDEDHEPHTGKGSERSVVGSKKTSATAEVLIGPDRSVAAPGSSSGYAIAAAPSASVSAADWSGGWVSEFSGGMWGLGGGLAEDVTQVTHDMAGSSSTGGSRGAWNTTAAVPSRTGTGASAVGALQGRQAGAVRAATSSPSAGKAAERQQQQQQRSAALAAERNAAVSPSATTDAAAGAMGAVQDNSAAELHPRRSRQSGNRTRRKAREKRRQRQQQGLPSPIFTGTSTILSSPTLNRASQWEPLSPNAAAAAAPSSLVLTPSFSPTADETNSRLERADDGTGTPLGTYINNSSSGSLSLVGRRGLGVRAIVSILAIDAICNKHALLLGIDAICNPDRAPSSAAAATVASASLKLAWSIAPLGDLAHAYAEAIDGVTGAVPSPTAAASSPPLGDSSREQVCSSARVHVCGSTSNVCERAMEHGAETTAVRGAIGFVPFSHRSYVNALPRVCASNAASAAGIQGAGRTAQVWGVLQHAVHAIADTNLFLSKVEVVHAIADTNTGTARFPSSIVDVDVFADTMNTTERLQQQQQQQQSTLKVDIGGGASTQQQQRLRVCVPDAHLRTSAFNYESLVSRASTWQLHPLGEALVAHLAAHLDRCSDVQTLAGVAMALTPTAHGDVIDPAPLLSERSSIGIVSEPARMARPLLSDHSSSNGGGGSQRPYAAAHDHDATPFSPLGSYLHLHGGLIDLLPSATTSAVAAAVAAPMLTLATPPLPPSDGGDNRDRGKTPDHGVPGVAAGGRDNRDDASAASAPAANRDDDEHVPDWSAVCSVYAAQCLTWGALSVRAQSLKAGAAALAREEIKLKAGAAALDDYLDTNYNNDPAAALARCDSKASAPPADFSLCCSVCSERLFRSVAVLCPACGHGGHPHHLQHWFSGSNGPFERASSSIPCGPAECPTGCGCDCTRYYS